MRPHLNTARFKQALAGALRPGAVEILDGHLDSGHITLPEVDLRLPENVAALFWTCPTVRKLEWVEAWHMASEWLAAGKDFDQFLNERVRRRFTGARRWLMSPYQQRASAGIWPRSIIKRLAMMAALHSDGPPVIEPYEVSVTVGGRTYSCSNRSMIVPVDYGAPIEVMHTMSAPPEAAERDLVLPEIVVPNTRPIMALQYAADEKVSPLLARYLAELGDEAAQTAWMEAALTMTGSKALEWYLRRVAPAPDVAAKENFKLSEAQAEALLEHPAADLSERFVTLRPVNLTALFKALAIDSHMISYTEFVDRFGKPFTRTSGVRWKTPHSDDQAAKFNQSLAEILARADT